MQFATRNCVSYRINNNMKNLTKLDLEKGIFSKK